MSVKNLVFTRIDDRLIHGQVMTAWIHQFPECAHIMVVDDQVSKDPFMTKMFQLLLPEGTTIETLSVDDAAPKLKEGLARQTILLAKFPLTIKRLVDAGVGIDFVNIGGMGMSAGRKKFYKNIAASPEEREIFKELVAKGITTSIDGNDAQYGLLTIPLAICVPRRNDEGMQTASHRRVHHR